MSEAEGIIVKLYANTYEVISGGEIYKCKLGGRLKLLDAKVTKPVSVGDIVQFEPPSNKDGEGLIFAAKQRKSKLSRCDPADAKREQIVVANADFVIVCQSFDSPPLNLFEIDRCILMGLSGECKIAIVVNKVDLASPAAGESLEIYRQLGYPVIFTSALKGDGIEEVRNLLAGRLSVLLGPSGVGKTSMINRLRPDLNLKTKKVSEKTGRGKHTTTVSILDIGDAMVVDTPGMEFFSIWGVDASDLQFYFEEFKKAGECRFNNCSHLEEPGCAVLEAVKQGKIGRRSHQDFAEGTPRHLR